MAEEMTKITSGTLIAAEKVEGTDVYNLQGEKLGTVDDIMIDKVSGKAIYAVMSFGGFLGIGQKYHPLPWSTLRYDENKGGYVVNLDKRMLENAPTYDMGEDFRWTPATAARSTSTTTPRPIGLDCRSNCRPSLPMGGSFLAIPGGNGLVVGALNWLISKEKAARHTRSRVRRTRWPAR
jgi:hypothetical protein